MNDETFKKITTSIQFNRTCCIHWEIMIDSHYPASFKRPNFDGAHDVHFDPFNHAIYSLSEFGERGDPLDQSR